jgi:hypothetical protein
MMDTIKDYITGNSVPDIGAEMNRQAVERLLVDHKGYDRTEVAVDQPVVLMVARERYEARIDLAVRLDGLPVMIIKCVAGSLGSWQREALAAARLIHADYQIPLSVVSDGKHALVQDTTIGKTLGDGLDAIPGRSDMVKRMARFTWPVLPADRREREALIFRSYNAMRINVG